jgi:hypothetical protein
LADIIAALSGAAAPCYRRLQACIRRVGVMRKITIAALFLVALGGTAFAQSKYDAEDAAKKRDAAVLDKQYKTILELTDKPTEVKVDPWHNMRSAGGSDSSKAKH